MPNRVFLMVFATPRPRTNRPLAAWSSCAAVLAVRTGGRRAALAIAVPTRTRRVAAATGWHSASASPCPSATNTALNPASSAAPATAPTAAGGSPLCDAIDSPIELTDHRLPCLPCVRNVSLQKRLLQDRHSATSSRKLITMIDLAAVISQVRRGMIPAHVYGDPEIFALERDRLFSRSWVFLAHESEIPDPGDYVVRRVLNDSFIVVRDEARTVRVMFNMCLHRGMQVCRAEMGNASHFRCPYHAWTYRNDGRLAGLPFHEDAYGGEDGFPRKGQRLLPAPAMDTYRGLIFISLDAEAPPLRDYLGDFAFYLDFYVNQSSAGIKVSGPQRWRVKANWKIGAENFAGDSYHTPHTHASVVEIGLFREPKASKRKEGALYQAGPGAGTTYKLPPGGDFAAQLRYVGYPDEMIPAMTQAWSDRQRALVEDSGFMVSSATLFPNLSLVHNWPQIDERGTVAPFISLRQWQPVSERETEVLSWFAVDAAAPEEFKRDSYKAYLMCFGTSGMFEQDDVENWVSITDMATGSMARRLNLNSRMGLTSDGKPLKPPIAAFAGPGVAYQGFGEYGQRHWLSQWSDHLEREPAAPGAVNLGAVDLGAVNLGAVNPGGPR